MVAAMRFSGRAPALSQSRSLWPEHGVTKVLRRSGEDIGTGGQKFLEEGKMLKLPTDSAIGDLLFSFLPQSSGRYAKEEADVWGAAGPVKFRRIEQGWTR